MYLDNVSFTHTIYGGSNVIVVIEDEFFDESGQGIRWCRGDARNMEEVAKLPQAISRATLVQPRNHNSQAPSALHHFLLNQLHLQLGKKK